MTAWFTLLADKLRHAFGFSGDEVAELQSENTRRAGENMLRRKRMKVAAVAIILGLVSASIELPLPAEDFYRAVRADIRARPAPQDIAFIAVDDKSIKGLNGALPNRVDESRMIDRLVSLGVQRIAFDRSHASVESPAADTLFTQTLARHQGRVWLGMVSQKQRGSRTIDELLPRPEFRKEAGIAAMTARGSPFGLSLTLSTSDESNGRTYPSLSAVLANYTGPQRAYRPDYAFDPRTIPTFSYIDVLQGRVAKGALDGKNVIIGEAYLGSKDYYYMPLKDGIVPGAYFHIMGAQTLKRGVPTDMMWFAAMALAALAIAWTARSGPKSMANLGILTVGLLVAPFVFDDFGINIDVMSALLTIGGATYGFRRINSKYMSGTVNAMTTSAISSDEPSDAFDVYSLKIANMAEISEDWSPREIGEFVNTLIAYVKAPGEVGDVAFERDILVWLSPRMSGIDLERHADGLALMLKTAISHDWQSSNCSPALGIDTNHSLPVALRIKKAMQAADEAASRGVRYIINDAAHLEARNNRIELVRVLEKGLRNRDIGVAYQPKIDLASGRIVGAETLIRWRPDGGDLVNPQDLVLAAEAGDRINELTLLVLETALQDGRQAIALDPRFKLAVNMSAKSLSDTHLLFDIMTMLGRYGFPPENLTLELTETAKLEDDRIAPQVAALKARGIGLSIDDFGTGQSNLEYIEKLPSSELKIDKRFVQHMASSEESRAVVRATIEIAHSLGKIVVAEGVEDFAVASTLRAMGCDQAQGYLFSKAIPMRDLLVMMGGGRETLTA